MIKNLSLIFGSKTKAEEIVYLLSKAKTVVRQGFYPEELPKVEKFCKENNIHFVKSRFKVLLADETAYSNKGIRIPEHDKRQGMYFCYFSKDQQKAWLASYYEMMNNNKDLGLLLGYPKCCVDFFCKRFSENNPNLQLSPTNMFTNITKREKDVVLIPHFPCSPDCEESVQLGREHLAIIREADYERYKELLSTFK